MDHSQVEKGTRRLAPRDIDSLLVSHARHLAIVKLFVGTAEDHHRIDALGIGKQRLLQDGNSFLLMILVVLSHEHF